MRDSVSSRFGARPPDTPIRAALPFEAALFAEGVVVPPTDTDSAATLVITSEWGSREARVEGPSLAYRWNWPGRALALTLSYGADTLSPFILLHPVPGTTRGWEEYAASVAGELGLYTDPVDAYGRLLHEGWNAALMVADVGTHYFGWTRQQAIAVMRPWSIASDAVLDSLFVARILQAPGEAGAPTIGAREFAAMRSWMQAQLGTGFDPGGWHHEVMNLGPVPLPVLATHLEWWAWSQRMRARERR
jgi:uncharacterized protein (DUF885 family)